MASNSSISSWGNTRDTPPSDWEFESISQAPADDSVEVTSVILTNWHATNAAAYRKQKIGPKSRGHAPMPSIREKHKDDLRLQHFREKTAALHIQRWFRDNRAHRLTNLSCGGLRQCTEQCLLL